MTNRTVVDVEMFTPARNNAILRLPGRKFPGVVVQGDTLASLVATVEDITRRVAGNADDELLAAAEWLLETLNAMRVQYEEVLARNGIPLPYERFPRPDRG